MSNCVHPCSCGFFGDSQKPCTCATAVVTKYQKSIFGPILDRIDIHIEVPRMDYEKLSGDRLGESSESIRKRVQVARDIQYHRFTNLPTSPPTQICVSVRRGKFVSCSPKVRVCCERQHGVVHESTSTFSACLAPHPQVIPYYCRPSWE